MANIKSAKKRILVTEKKTAQNKVLKSAFKTQLKKFDAALSSENTAELDALYKETVSQVDKAVVKGIIHKNKGAHKKAQLAKKMMAVAK